MDSKRVLVTGGAGFIGSHLVDSLIQRGHRVTVYDNLDAQVHGEGNTWPEYLHEDAEKILGDVRDRDRLAAAVRGAEVVFHLAAAVGVGQSMYRIEHYVDVNARGMATILDILANEKHRVQKLLVASSMSIYGEGLYKCASCGLQSPSLRSEADLRRGRWELFCPTCRSPLQPVPTPETKTLNPTSVYALTKRFQEESALLFGRTYQLPVVALRFFNVYGSRQALSNPYTGVAAIFSSRLLNHRPPVIFEDGKQSRDFIHVDDLVLGMMAAMENGGAEGRAINLGTGQPVTILEVARQLTEQIDGRIEPEVRGRYRKGDVRHCYADVSLARDLLRFEPRISFKDGIARLVQWIREQKATDLFGLAEAELTRQGLTQ